MVKYIELIETIDFPTIYGKFILEYYKTSYPEQAFMRFVLVLRTAKIAKTPNVRVHSECILSEVFHSTHCDCQEQLDKSMKYISKHGGMLIYLNQEGRGHGLENKVRELKLQEAGHNTVTASQHLNLEVDMRSYESVVDILKQMDISSINLLTNNPRKIKYLKDRGIEVNRLPLKITPNSHNAVYLKTKRDLLGHLLSKRI